MPVEVGADGDADGNPRRRNACRVGKAGHAHEHPAAHVGRFGTHGRNPRPQAAAAENIVAQPLLGAGIINADCQHGPEVEDEGGQNRQIILHHNGENPFQYIAIIIKNT